MKRITVFCGSSPGTAAIYRQQAYLLGKTMAENNLSLIYGGSKTGLMGAVANGVIENSGKAIGVLPHFLKAKEVAHVNLSELIMVDTMHERKARMNEISDAAIALPGGFGTLEELFEMLTWAKLGLHQKPVGILNTDGFYDDLMSLMENMAEKGFISTADKQMLLVSSSVVELLELLKNNLKVLG
jgi:uncharacterized protein (TIGR00730 family)